MAGRSSGQPQSSRPDSGHGSAGGSVGRVGGRRDRSCVTPCAAHTVDAFAPKHAHGSACAAWPGPLRRRLSDADGCHCGGLRVASAVRCCSPRLLWPVARRVASAFGRPLFVPPPAWPLGACAGVGLVAAWFVPVRRVGGSCGRPKASAPAWSVAVGPVSRGPVVCAALLFRLSAVVVAPAPVVRPQAAAVVVSLLSPGVLCGGLGPFVALGGSVAAAIVIGV